MGNNIPWHKMGAPQPPPSQRRAMKQAIAKGEVTDTSKMTQGQGARHLAARRFLGFLRRKDEQDGQ